MSSNRAARLRFIRPTGMARGGTSLILISGLALFFVIVFLHDTFYWDYYFTRQVHLWSCGLAFSMALISLPGAMRYSRRAAIANPVLFAGRGGPSKPNALIIGAILFCFWLVIAQLICSLALRLSPAPFATQVLEVIEAAPCSGKRCSSCSYTVIVNLLAEHSPAKLCAEQLDPAPLTGSKILVHGHFRDQGVFVSAVQNLAHVK